LAHAIFTARPRKRRGRIVSLRSLFGRLPARCLAHMSDWRRRERDRRLLDRLDERALRDLGIDRALAETDSAIPFWSLQVSRKIML
jgi:uncharacterized protein YjiS (DUF1127 family)